MQNLKYEVEAIQISIYCDIIKQILRKHEELSLSKMLVFSYLIKNDCNGPLCQDRFSADLS